MPIYDCSLRDFLQYVSTQTKDQEEEFFPLTERFQMTIRILRGVLYMNQDMCKAHRDIKLRQVFEKRLMMCMLASFDRSRFNIQKQKQSKII